MNSVDVLNALKTRIEEDTSDILLHTSSRGEDPKYAMRKAATVYRQRLPKEDGFKDEVPYIIVQVTNSTFDSSPSCTVRLVCVTYFPGDCEESALGFLTLCERIRYSLMKNPVVGKFFKVDTEKGIELEPYHEDFGDYTGGEIVFTLSMPRLVQEFQNL